MAKRRPQINFQVDESMKLLYEEAKTEGLRVTRLCAAGFLLMIDDPQARSRALSRLREWEERFVDADVEQVRAFVRGAQDALQAPARDSQPKRPAHKGRKRARSSES